MTEKRFYIEDEHIKDNLEAHNPFYVETYNEAKRFSELLNDLNQEVIDAEHHHTVVLENFKAISKDYNKLKEENEQLKSTIVQFSSDFMNFKMKLIEQIQIHYDYARKQMQKNLDNPLLAEAYNSMCYEVRELAGEMSLDLNVMRFIKANKEIDELKRINKKLNKVCIDYSFKMEKLEKENEELKKRNEYLKKRCDEYLEEAGLNSDYFE